MVDALKVRTKIETKIFDGLGSTLTASSVVDSNLDKWGDATDNIVNLGSISCVPWSHNKLVVDFQPFGDLNVGEVDIAFKYDQTLAVGYLVTLSGKVYEVKAVEEFPLKDIILLKVARLSERHE